MGVMRGLTSGRACPPSRRSVSTISMRSAAGSRLTAWPRRARRPRCLRQIGPDAGRAAGRGTGGRSARPRRGRPRAGNGQGCRRGRGGPRNRSISVTIRSKLRLVAAPGPGLGQGQRARAVQPGQGGQQRGSVVGKACSPSRLVKRNASPTEPPASSASAARSSGSTSPPAWVSASARSVRRQGRQPQFAAARADGGQKPVRLVRDQEQRHAGGRFFQQFQQGVGGGGVHLVDAVDDGDAAAAIGGRQREEDFILRTSSTVMSCFRRAASCRHRARRSRNRRRLGQGQRCGGRPGDRRGYPACRAGAGRTCRRHLRRGQQEAGDFPGQRGLADAARTGDQPAVVQAAGR